MAGKTIWWEPVCGNRSIYDAFWSDDLTINTTRPDLTHCLQETVITWAIYGFSILANGVYALMLRADDTRNFGKLSRFCRIKLNLVLLTVACLVGGFLYDILQDTGDKGPYLVPADLIAAPLKVVAIFVVGYLEYVQFRKGVISSGNLFFFWFFAMLQQCTLLFSSVYRWEKQDPYLHLATYIFQCLYFTMVGLQFLCTLRADLQAMDGPPKTVLDDDDERKPLVNEKAKVDDVEPGLVPNPATRAPFWKRISFMWFTGFVVQGYRHYLTFDGLPDICPSEKVKNLLPNFYRWFYTGEENTPGKSSPPPKRSFTLALNLAVIKPFFIASLFRMLAIPVQFVNPQLLSLLIVFIESGDTQIWKGLSIAGCMLAVNFTNSILINNFLFASGVAGMRGRSIVNSVVYRKALRLSSSARRQTTVGQIVNLMSVDAQKVQDFFLFTTLLWSVPLMIVLAMYFLWQEVGPSCLAGLAVLCVLVPLNAMYLAKKAMQLQIQQMRQKDDRFRLMGEILAGMKVLKLYAWEKSFQEQVKNYREKELVTIKYANYINAFGSMCWLISPYLVSLAIFAAYVLSSSDNVLDAEKAFVTISLINLLNWPMSLLPMGVNNTVQGLVSMGRIAKFLSLDELDDDTTVYGSVANDQAISMENCTMSWGKNEPPSLTNIDFRVKRGTLVAVVGAVGSGKSSLISALLGELHKSQGNVEMNGGVAYVPQQAWIQNDTLQGNILFGRSYREHKYKSICDACALTPDLKILPGGDLIEIGEKGINLSGGQKQRVSLSRAVYQDKDIYLLDDPLSAVDSHVGKHIFEKVIGPDGLLKGKSRVLVTHGISFLPYVDYIYVMKNGLISEHGQYDELMERRGAFAEFLSNYIADVDPEHSDEAEEMDRIIRVLSQEPEDECEDEQNRKLSGASRGSLSRQISRSISRKHSSGLRRRSTKATDHPPSEMTIRKKEAQLIQEETAQTGLINPQVLKAYIEAGGVFIMILVCLSELFFIVFQILTNLWLSQWSEDVLTNDTVANQKQAEFRVSVYGYMGIGQALFALFEAFAVAQGCYVASRVMHHRLLERILHAPMAFFDTTPLGRIINRFSKDLDVVDTNMPIYIRQWMFSLAPVFTTIALISYTSPIFVVVITIVIVLFVLLQRMYITAARQLKRLESVRRSPIYIHFDESISGAACIRAYGKENSFVAKCDRLIDESQRPWYLTLASYRWCAVCMESLGACVVFFSALFAVLQDNVSPSMAGLSVSYALQITVYLNSLVRNSSEMETYVVSIERIDEYCHVESEAAWEVPETKPPSDWPQEGKVRFENYNTRYRPGLDLVLRNINFNVDTNEKIGIVGRTGAGKSSLSLSLFRIIESAMGKIHIDGRDIGIMGLHDLRSKLSIIPQDPVIFSGSLRTNLDPFNQYSEGELWDAIEHAHLKEFVKTISSGLDYQVGEGGEALSVGQRQLVCLARAILRHSKILILDEATAAVDLETDSLIQTTIRTQFQNATILTVAHRLSTVMDYDRIMVLDQGEIAEYDAPSKLMQDKKSIFYSMAKDANLV